MESIEVSLKRTEQGVEYQWLLEKNYTAFWEQYKYLIARFYSYYCYLLNKYELNSEFDGFDDFYCSSWLIIKRAVDALKTEKIRDKNNWWAYVQISFYLRNYVNRQLINKRIKERSQTNNLIMSLSHYLNT